MNRDHYQWHPNKIVQSWQSVKLASTISNDSIVTAKKKQKNKCHTMGYNSFENGIIAIQSNLDLLLFTTKVNSDILIYLRAIIISSFFIALLQVSQPTD